MKNAFVSPHSQQRITAAGVDLAYVDTGPRQRTPLVFLHGNPTSSFLWRNIISPLAGRYRCLAPDLAGMGNSGPMPGGGYRFVDHVCVIDAWLDAMVFDRPIVFICHDWGSALAFHWAHRNRRRVSAIAYMEAIVLPRSWSDFPEGRDRIFRPLRGAEGEKLVLEQNFFVETVLPKSSLHAIADEVLDVYRAPFPTPQSRYPTLVWPRELPIEGEPPDVVEIVEAYGAWLQNSDLAKLFINAEHGTITIGRAREFCRSWANQREVTVNGMHYVQEDAPQAVAGAITEFLDDLHT